LSPGAWCPALGVHVLGRARRALEAPPVPADNEQAALRAAPAGRPMNLDDFTARLVIIAVWFVLVVAVFAAADCTGLK